MRLIDADKLIDSMDDRYKEKVNNVPDNLAEGFMQMGKLIKQQPTAFDVDKVVEQLEEENALYCAKFIICKKKGNDTLAKENLDRANLLDKAIEVVKAGGIDE